MGQLELVYKKQILTPEVDITQSEKTRVWFPFITHGEVTALLREALDSCSEGRATSRGVNEKEVK